METVLVVLLVLVLLGVGFTVAAVALFLRSLDLRNRVSPSRRSPAPAGWIWSPRLAARLHRRLRALVLSARAAVASRPSTDLGLYEIVAELEGRACEVDLQLVVADRAPQPARTRMLRELQSETRELERLVERVIRMSRAWAGATPSERGLGPIRERLDLLEQALRELDGLEAAGLPQDLPARIGRHGDHSAGESRRTTG